MSHTGTHQEKKEVNAVEKKSMRNLNSGAIISTKRS